MLFRINDLPQLYQSYRQQIEEQRRLHGENAVISLNMGLHRVTEEPPVGYQRNRYATGTAQEQIAAVFTESEGLPNNSYVSWIFK
jgi:hypothetical protein